MTVRFRCTDLDSGNQKEMDLLECIYEHDVSITPFEFRKGIGPKSWFYLSKSLGYTTGLRLDDDWAVQFMKSELPSGRKCWHLDWSAIDYIIY